MTRKLYEIANDISRDWRNVTRSPAYAYLEAMHNLATLDDKYGLDSGKGIVCYFLANAATWKGEVARRVKKELNDILKAAS